MRLASLPALERFGSDRWVRLLLFSALSLLLLPMPAGLAADPPQGLTSPLFGLATTRKGGLLVADYGAGIVELSRSDDKHHGDEDDEDVDLGAGRLIVSLPGVTDVAPLPDKQLFVLTGFGDGANARKLFRANRDGAVHEIADLLAFETSVNPDGGLIDSNPFDVEALPGEKALVADAAANDLLLVDARGRVDWIATLPDELVSTDDFKSLVGCPTPVPGFEFACGLPPVMPAQAVATSVAVGPDGAYYVGELKGFPAPRGKSRVWRVDRSARHANCAVSPACKVVADGFTSIVDLTFDHHGTFYVTELDEASWAAVEFQLAGVGGTVNACDAATWLCTEVASALPIPTATAVDREGSLFAAIFALVPGQARVIALKADEQDD